MAARMRSAICTASSRAQPGTTDRELLAAAAGHQIDLTGDGRQGQADLAEHLVARLMAQGVVDRLEVVDVEPDQAERVCRSLGADRPRGPGRRRRPGGWPVR